ncbi:MAG: hypothetical protein NXI04_14745 [Planctomycetaceae bacterium]|nr:hypothetical protein [Planctomycetaceae bacterium]
MKFKFRTAVVACLSLVLTLGSRSSALATDPDHWDLAMDYTTSINPAFNFYGSDCEIYYIGNLLFARSMCGSYVAKVHRQAYPNLTYTVMSSLFEWGSPNAERWYDGIIEQRSYSNNQGTFGTVCLTNLWNMSRGDILVSKYDTGSASGHVMMLGDVWSFGVFPLNGEIPGFNQAEVSVVSILDSTSSPHGDYDTRKGAEANNADDQGIGAAFILILTDPNSGEIIGWTWSTSASTIYQCTDPTMEDTYRPLIGGYIYGPGVN